MSVCGYTIGYKPRCGCDLYGLLRMVCHFCTVTKCNSQCLQHIPQSYPLQVTENIMDEADFTGFEPFELTDIKLTENMLGHGSYATVQEVE